MIAVKVTVVDSLRVRSQPRVSDDSYKYEPLLPFDTPLYVLDGPVSASGYVWYEVIPLTAQSLPHGWVASASRDGEPWIAERDYACPPVPTDFRSLAALPSGVGLACFPRVPITVEARLVECNCDVDGGWYDPGWFGYYSEGQGPQPLLLIESAETEPPASFDWFVLHLDPAGQYPAAVTAGGLVEATGVYDHPAAARCTYTDPFLDNLPVPTQACRLEFAVTRLAVIGS